jgi:hypothetical protein
VGVRSRNALGVGVGNVWFDSERARSATDYGVTSTDQQDVVELAGADTSFAGLRFG